MNKGNDDITHEVKSCQLATVTLLNKGMHSKGLVPFTQLVKVRMVTLFWHFKASDFHETFTST